MNYKIKVLKLFLFFGLILGTASSTMGKLDSPNGDDIEAGVMRSIIVESWEGVPWVGTAYPNPPLSSVEVNTVNGRPANLQSDLNNKRSMGVRFQFVFPSTNSVTLTPPENRIVKRYVGVLGNDNKPKFRNIPGIELPGRVDTVSVWVLGRGNKYILYGFIEDWKGTTHKFKFGSLNFLGWRPLNIKIPSAIPQGTSSYPQTKSLIFKKFMIESEPLANQEKVVLFFDSLKVLTDVYEPKFGGIDIDFDPEDRAEKEKVRKETEALLNPEPVEAPVAE